jgi:hypothetical protein
MWNQNKVKRDEIRLYREAALGIEPWATRHYAIKTSNSEPSADAPCASGALRSKSEVTPLDGFLISLTSDPSIVRVQRYSTTSDEIEETDTAHRPYFVIPSEQRLATTARSTSKAARTVDIPTKYLSRGQIQWLIGTFVLMVIAGAVNVSVHTVGNTALADYLGYALPVCAAVLVGIQLYFRRRVRELLSYELSVVLLFLGVLFNAAAKPCGDSIIVIFCAIAALSTTCVLVRRVYLFRATENAWRSIASTFLPLALVGVLLIAITFAIIYFHDFFQHIGGHYVCPKPYG